MAQRIAVTKFSMFKALFRRVLSAYETAVGFRSPEMEGIRARWQNYHRGSYQSGVSVMVDRIAKRGGVCVDVGANIGVIAKQMAKRVGRTGKVIAIEANPTLFPLLRYNLRRLSQAECVSCAAGEKVGTMTLRFSEFETGRGSLVMPSGDQEASVEIRPLSSILKQRVIARVDLLKIDVEGFELSVLNGLSEIMPNAIIIEYNQEFQIAAGIEPNVFLNWFNERQYAVSVVGDQHAAITSVRDLPSDGVDLVAVRACVHSEGSSQSC